MSHFPRVSFPVGVGALLLAVWAVLGAGCASAGRDLADTAKQTAYFTPANHHGEARLPATVRRVLLLPVSGGRIVPEDTAASLENVLATELLRAVRFEVVRLSRTECLQRFGSPEFSSAGPLPHDFMPTLARAFAVDAVLFVDVTAYRAYRPLALGLRAKLATVESTRLLWTFDDVFDADDVAVANSVRRYYETGGAGRGPLDSAHGALQSPNRFAAYVAAATFETLPPR
jgi:hypothetical protein